LDYVATVPLPPNTDPCLFAGFLRDKNVELVKCRTSDLEIPANAEIVIEGYIDTAEPLQPSGKLAIATGYYREERQVARMQVSAVTHRANPIYPALICGPAPMEDFWMNKASERILQPLVTLHIPEIVDYHMPRAGLFRHLLFVSIRKQYAQQARKVMNALWSFGPLTVAKVIVIVDQDVDVHNEEEVWFHVGANVHPGRDTVFCEGPAHIDDHAAPAAGLGHKIGIDATRKIPGEGKVRDWPDELKMNEATLALIQRRWPEYGID